MSLTAFVRITFLAAAIALAAGCASSGTVAPLPQAGPHNAHGMCTSPQTPNCYQ